MAETIVSEAVHFLVLRHEGDRAGLAGDLLALDFAPIITIPVLPLAERAADIVDEALGVGWGLACAAAVAQRDRVPLVSFHAIDIAGITTVRLRR